MSNDDLGAHRCPKVAHESLTAGKSVVIDNTNPSLEARQKYIKIAEELKVPVRCIFFQVDKDTCMHNNFMRKANTFRNHLSKAVPSVAIHSWFKNHEKPSKDEGFCDIVTV